MDQRSSMDDDDDDDDASILLCYVGGDGTLGVAAVNPDNRDVATLDVVLLDRISRLTRCHRSLYVIHDACDPDASLNAEYVARVLRPHCNTSTCTIICKSDTDARPGEGPVAILRRHLRSSGVRAFRPLPYDPEEEWTRWIRWDELSLGPTEQSGERESTC